MSTSLFYKRLPVHGIDSGLCYKNRRRRNHGVYGWPHGTKCYKLRYGSQTIRGAEIPRELLSTRSCDGPYYASDVMTALRNCIQSTRSGRGKAPMLMFTCRTSHPIVQVAHAL